MRRLISKYWHVTTTLVITNPIKIVSFIENNHTESTLTVHNKVNLNTLTSGQKKAITESQHRIELIPTTAAVFLAEARDVIVYSGSVAAAPRENNYRHGGFMFVGATTGGSAYKRIEPNWRLCRLCLSEWSEVIQSSPHFSVGTLEVTSSLLLFKEDSAWNYHRHIFKFIPSRRIVLQILKDTSLHLSLRAKTHLHAHFSRKIIIWNHQNHISNPFFREIIKLVITKVTSSHAFLQEG